MKFKRKQKKKVMAMQNSHVYSMSPLKDLLRYYNELSVRGFNSEAIASTLTQLFKALKARGTKARVMNDYTTTEMD